MSVNHIIWDWNGTLLDDVWLCVEVMNGLLDKHSLPPITADSYRSDFEFPVYNYYRKLGFPAERSFFEALSLDFIADYDSRRFECSLQATAAEVIHGLAADGLSQTVLSAYHERTLNEVIDHYGLRQPLTAIAGQNNIYAEGKVKRGLDLISELQIDPGETVLIGDTVHDHEVATAMGTQCILLDIGHHPRAKLQTLGVMVCSSLSEADAQIRHIAGTAR